MARSVKGEGPAAEEGEAVEVEVEVETVGGTRETNCLAGMGAVRFVEGVEVAAEEPAAAGLGVGVGKRNGFGFERVVAEGTDEVDRRGEAVFEAVRTVGGPGSGRRGAPPKGCCCC